VLVVAGFLAVSTHNDVVASETARRRRGERGRRLKQRYDELPNRRGGARRM
jgi:hypothetical protein